MIQAVIEAGSAREAIRLANSAIDSGSASVIEANVSLRRRAIGLHGAASGSFTPRVANLWLEGGSGAEFLALITLAASQDYTYPCESQWTVRKVVAADTLRKMGDESFLRRCLGVALKDRYLFNRLAVDFNDLLTVLKLASRSLSKASPNPLPPPLPEPEVSEVRERRAITDNWLKLKLKE